MVQVPTISVCRVVRRLVARGASCSHTHAVGLLGTWLKQLPGDANPVSAHTSTKERRKEGCLKHEVVSFSGKGGEGAVNQALRKGEAISLAALVFSQGSGLQCSPEPSCSPPRSSSFPSEGTARRPFTAAPAPALCLPRRQRHFPALVATPVKGFSPLASERLKSSVWLENRYPRAHVF